MTKDLFSIYPLVRFVFMEASRTKALRLMFFFDKLGIGLQGVTGNGIHLMLTVNIVKLEMGFTISCYDSLEE